MTIPNRIALGFLLLCLSALCPANAAPHPSTYYPGQLLVKFKADSSKASAKAARPIAGAKIKADMPRLGWKLVQLPEGTDVASALADWRSRPDVAYAEPNYKIQLFATPNDPRFPGMWNLEKIAAPEAWDVTTGSSNMVVAVIDTGLDFNHADIAANVWNNPGEVPDNGYDDDWNGYVDDVHGINLLDGGPNVQDDDGHGTHVAGTIGAVGNNSLGSVGINWNVKLLVLKIFTADDGAGTAGAVEGYEYLLALKQRGINIRVVNNSWGGPVPSQALAEAMRAAEAAGILSVCAAGNAHHNVDDQPEFPANLDVESLISVAASTRDDAIASFSNYGERTVDIAAPGESIPSTYKGTGRYMNMSGTSMACPHVSGAAALLFAQNGSLTPANVKAILMETADKLPQWQGKVAAQGRLNAAKALARVVSGPIPTLAPDTNDFALPYPKITAISRNSKGRYGNEASYFPSISTNGQRVAYLSLATNLTAGVTGTSIQVFVYDRSARTTLLVSRSNSGIIGNGDCSDVRISGDGRFIAFSSEASNLVANDANGVSDIFLYDIETGQIELISRTSSGASGNGLSEYTGISDDGRYVVFSSEASNLIASDLNGYRDIFVRDRQAGTTACVSISTGSAAADYISDLPSISGDGRYVAFLSGADNLVTTTYFPAYQLYLRDRTGNKTTLVSKSSTGVMGRDNCGFSALSADGRYLAFESYATNLVSGDTNEVQDMFLYDRVNVTIKRISVGNSGAQADDDSWLPHMSSDGRHTYFMSFASTLNSQDDDYACDIFDYDRLTGKLSRLTYSHAGRTGMDDSFAPSSSFDGRFVAFDSRAWNLVPSGGNGARDVFVLDRGSSIPDLMIDSSSATNFQGLGLYGTNIVQRRQLSATNGVAAFSIRLVNSGPASELFYITARPAPAGWSGQYFRGTTNITAAVTGAGWTASLAAGSNVDLKLEVSSADASVGEFWAEFFVTARGLSTESAIDAVRAVATRLPSPPALQVVSRAPDGRIGNNSCETPSVSADARYVAFTSTASDLTSHDYNLQEDVFVIDRQTGVLECVSKPDTETANGRSYHSQISRDGRYVLFQSSATNLVAGDTNDREDIFLYDRQTKSTSRLSTGSGGAQSSRDSVSPSMSGNARYVAFESLAANFVSGDQNGTWDIFLKDRTAGTMECLSMAGSATANDESHSPVVSNDGSLVVFTSLASNLVPGDTNGVSDVFLWQRGVSGVQLLSRTASGIPGNDLSSYPSISDDNRYILFSSRATNLAVTALSTNSITYMLDRNTGVLSQLNPPWIQGRQEHAFFGAQIAPDGQKVTLLADVPTVPDGSNIVTGVFLYNRTTDKTIELSRMRSGVAGNDQSDGAAVSADGRYVAMLARSSNLLGEVGPAVDQAVLFDLAGFQPDGWIRHDNSVTYRGQETFSPSVQWVEQPCALKSTNTFYITIYNSGNLPDYFIFKGAVGITGLNKTRYFLEPAGTDITTSATNAGWKTPLLAPGESREIRVRVIVGNTNLFNQDLVFTSKSVTDPTKVDQVRVRLLRDDDKDGLPNSWEQQFFGNTTATLAAADSDGDGISNYLEYVAGTNPNDPSSNLRITEVKAEGGLTPGLTLAWPGATNRIYTVERATNAPAGFAPVGQIYGTAPASSYFDAVPAGSPPAFYRVRAEVP